MIGNKRLASTLVTAVILLMVIAACAPPAPEVVEVTVPVEVEVEVETTVEVPVTVTPVVGPQPGGTMVIGLSAEIMTLDPADYRDTTTETVIRNMFDGLVTRSSDGRVLLQLAESATLIDGVTWEFVLKKGVTFHNGEDLTAEDVKFTFDRIITENAIEYPEPHTSPRKGLIGPVESVEIVDDYTVRLYLSAPFPAAMQMLVHQQIVPKDYFEQVGTEGFIEAPVGCGPFKFVEGSLGDQIVMERFDDYYGGADELPPVGPPLLDRVIFRILPEASTRVSALRAGEVNIIQSVPSHMIPVLATNASVRVASGPSTRPAWMEMNVNQPPFDDVRVRLAMNYAVDAETILDTVLGGLGVVIAGPLSPYNNFADPTLEPYGYDPDKALELLAEAGWTDSDEDGFLDQDGEIFTFVIDVRPTSKPRAEGLAGQLQELGIDATVRVWGDYSVLKPLMLDGERTAYVGDWGDSAFDPVGHFEAKWHSRVEGTGNGRGNFSGYSNPRVDELVAAGEIEADVERRHELYNEAQQLVYEEAPAVFLFLPDIVEASSASVQNWTVAADGRLNMHDVWFSE
ncbi:MAG: ABC transporter substrate-binding protein [Ardenticatenales bacterium]|nr:ABC transporter substrate-binding protein [Ardenticatenales bacterium]